MSPLSEENSDSADEALCEILGLTSLEGVESATDDDDDETHPKDRQDLLAEMTAELQNSYKTDSVCVLPRSLSVSACYMRRLTDELVWGQDVQVDKTYETIRVLKTSSGQIEERRTLTRLENFVSHHEGWNKLCHGYLKECISAICGQQMVLYKEKLNLKPVGGSGFAPHLDTPSLRVALGESGPQTFVTVMVAIDNMTTENGCS